MDRIKDKFDNLPLVVPSMGFDTGKTGRINNSPVQAFTAHLHKAAFCNLKKKKVDKQFQTQIQLKLEMDILPYLIQSSLLS